MPRARPPAGPTLREEAEAIFAELLAAMPADPSGDPERWRVHELLAYLVGFHHRENKPVYWAKYEWLKMSDEELAEDPDCLAGIERTKRKPFPEKRSMVYEYAFDPAQETKLREGSKWLAAHDEKLRDEIHSFDGGQGLLTIKSTKSLPSRMSLIPNEHVPSDTMEASLQRIARRWAKKAELPGALGDLLHRRAPRLEGSKRGGPILANGEDAKTGTIRVVSAMKETTLAIQGPPGTGKTHVGAAAIAHLLAAGFRVGITSHSHKVTEHLMGEALAVANKGRRKVRATKVGGPDDSALFDQHAVEYIDTVGNVSFARGGAPELMGGTAWAFSSPHAEGQFDYLFVDEAGQVSLANLVAMSPAAKNLVLLGDQMQLPQPLKGVHPGESGTSALEYLLTGRDGKVHETIPPELGIFLPTTHRMHPAVCRFISEAIYMSRLEPEPHTKHRVVLSGKGKSRRVPIEAGLCFVPVDHEDNVQESEEEVEAIEELVVKLRARQLIEKERAKPRQVTDADILVVAPYNRQVNLLRAALPKLRIGTVDLFQGQQAPIVILSMCASSAEDAPRGLEFLLNRNRLNVAISRAQSLAIIVASPALTRTRVTSVGQMRLVNLFCRAIASSSQN